MMSTYGGPGMSGQASGAGPGAWQGAGPGAGPGWGGGGYFVTPKPGVIPLRPLGIGEIISGVFGTLKRYLRAIYYPVLAVTLGAVVLVGAAVGVAFLLLGGRYDDFRNDADYLPTTGQTVGLVAAIVAVGLLVLISVLAVTTVASTTSTAVLRHAVLGRPATVRQTWAESRPHLWRVLRANILVGLAGLGIFVGSFLPAVVLGLVTGSGAVAGVSLLCVIPGYFGAIYVTVRLVLVIPMLVLEEQPVIATIRRAWKLNEGAWWRSAGIPVLVGMIASFATQTALFPFMMVGVVPLYGSMFSQPLDANGQVPAPSLSSLVLFGVVMLLGGAVANALALPLTPLTHGLLYVDRRIRTENLLPSLATEAGIPLSALTPPTPPPPYGWGGPVPAHTPGPVDAQPTSQPTPPPMPPPASQPVAGEGDAADPTPGQAPLQGPEDSKPQG